MPENKKRILSTNIEKATKIKENIILTESVYSSRKIYTNKTKFVGITIKDPNSQTKEKIIINPNSHLYKQYLKKEIDITTFCNLIFLETKQNKDIIEYETKNGITRILNKK